MDLPAGVTVDLITEADARLHAEVHRVLAAVTELEGAVGWTHVPSPAETAAWFEAELALAAAGRGGFAVARRDGVLEALGVWSGFAAPVIAHNGEVRRVMTHPDARGGGLARAVVLALTDDARRRGVEVLLLDVRGNNHGAQAMYDSLGWVEYGRIPDFIALGDERWDRVCYYLDLGRPPGTVRHGSAQVGAGSSARRATGS